MAKNDYPDDSSLDKSSLLILYKLWVSICQGEKSPKRAIGDWLYLSLYQVILLQESIKIRQLETFSANGLEAKSAGRGRLFPLIFWS
jgi:hypothetical protein